MTDCLKKYSWLQWGKAYKWNNGNMKGVPVPNKPGLYVFTDYDDKTLQPRGGSVGTQVLIVGSTNDIKTRLPKYKLSGTFSKHHAAISLQLFQFNLAGVITYIRWAVVDNPKHNLLSIEIGLIGCLKPSMNITYAPWNQIGR